MEKSQQRESEFVLNFVSKQNFKFLRLLVAQTLTIRKKALNIKYYK